MRGRRRRRRRLKGRHTAHRRSEREHTPMATRETGVRTADVVARCVVLPTFEREGPAARRVVSRVGVCVGGGASSFPQKHERRGGGEECGAAVGMLLCCRVCVRGKRPQKLTNLMFAAACRVQRETPICADERDVGREEDDDEPDEPDETRRRRRARSRRTRSTGGRPAAHGSNPAFG